MVVALAFGVTVSILSDALGFGGDTDWVAFPVVAMMLGSLIAAFFGRKQEKERVKRELEKMQNRRN
jgi:membrane associated rhomboid family serine protease